jgi:hypothetical protein
MRRLASVLMLGIPLVGSTPAALAQRGARMGGGARGAAPRAGTTARPATPAPQQRAAPTHTGRTGNVNAGAHNTHAHRQHANVTVNRSRDVNVHVNTVVRPAARPYARSPYVYGGHRYYAHHAYAYHRYTPYYWGRAYYPFGAFVATLGATAVAVAVANQSYHYYSGVWYLPASGGYTVVTAPVGGVVTTLPPEAVVVSGDTYYYGGAYYDKTGDGYKVVPPQAGTVVEKLPPGGEEVTIGDQKYVKFGDTYYQPIQRDGKSMYEVVEVK